MSAVNFEFILSLFCSTQGFRGGLEQRKERSERKTTRLAMCIYNAAQGRHCPTTQVGRPLLSETACRRFRSLERDLLVAASTLSGCATFSTFLLQLQLQGVGRRHSANTVYTGNGMVWVCDIFLHFFTIATARCGPATFFYICFAFGISGCGSAALFLHLVHIFFASGVGHEKTHWATFFSKKTPKSFLKYEKM